MYGNLKVTMGKQTSLIRADKTETWCFGHKSLKRQVFLVSLFVSLTFSVGTWVICVVASM